jgi:hypothetical protein
MGAGATTARQVPDEVGAVHEQNLKWAPSMGLPSVMSKKSLIDEDLQNDSMGMTGETHGLMHSCYMPTIAHAHARSAYLANVDPCHAHAHATPTSMPITVRVSAEGWYSKDANATKVTIQDFALEAVIGQGTLLPSIVPQPLCYY